MMRRQKERRMMRRRKTAEMTRRQRMPEMTRRQKTPGMTLQQKIRIKRNKISVEWKGYERRRTIVSIPFLFQGSAVSLPALPVTGKEME